MQSIDIHQFAVMKIRQIKEEKMNFAAFIAFIVLYLSPGDS
jgi:hypothetical protein